MRSKVLWTEDLTTSWLSTWCPSVPIPKDGFTPEELAEIEWIAAPHNEQLRSLGEEWAALADSNLWAQWKSGDFEKAPFSTIGVSQEQGFLAKAYASHGWSFVLVLKEEEYPDMAQLQREIEAARDAREAAIAEYARQRRHR